MAATTNQNGSAPAVVCEEWSFSISLHDDDDDNEHSLPDNVSTTRQPLVPERVLQQFRNDGYVAFDRVLTHETVAALNQRLEQVLRGQYDRGVAPDKAPRIIKSSSHNVIRRTSNNSSNNDQEQPQRQPTRISQTTREQPPPNTNSAAATTTTTATAIHHHPLGFTGNLQNVKVLQIINIHKSDQLFRRLACHAQLGRVVAELAGWNTTNTTNTSTTPSTTTTTTTTTAAVAAPSGGTRLAQDQVWAKPPRAAPLAFHRDAPYFMFQPDSVVTVWIALDDMDQELGPIEYVRGSHLWNTTTTTSTSSTTTTTSDSSHTRGPTNDDGNDDRKGGGAATQFFHARGGMKLLRSAAIQAGVMMLPNENETNGDPAESHTTPSQTMDAQVRQSLDIVSMAGLKAGSITIHDGRMWHGSGRNQSKTRPRRGLGLHFVPANVRFTKEAAKSRLWRPYVENIDCADVEQVELPNEDFPITWHCNE